MQITNASIAGEFLEVSSEQRLGIMEILHNKKSNLSSLAKQLDATAAEVHRNLGRLKEAGLIEKDGDGNYSLTMYGKIIYMQIPAFKFMIKNKKYFETHDFADTSIKFMQRIGALAMSEQITGYSKIAECWEEIYKNADKYIFNILIDVQYNEKILEILQNKLANKVNIQSIFSEKAIIPSKRQELLTRYDFSKHVKGELLKRKMSKESKIALIMNEKEAGICLPTINGETDMSKMFYGKDELFHEWCRDFFVEEWSKSSAFQESKIKS